MSTVTTETRLSCSVDRSEFQKALGRVLWAVPTRNTLPVLAGVLISAGEGGLRPRAGSIETWASTRCMGDVTEPGAILIPAKLLKDLTDHAPAGALRIETDEKRAVLAWNKGKATIATLPADDYPPERRPAGPEIEVPANGFLHAIRQVAFAASQDTSRPILTGIRLRIDGEGIHTLTCNGVRIVFHTETLQAAAGNVGSEAVEAVVVARDAERAARVFAEAGAAEQTLRLRIDPACVEIATPDIVIQVARLSGRYPDVEGLLPKEYPQTARVGRTALADALTRAVLVTDDEALHGIRFQATDGHLALHAQHTEIGTADEEIEGEISPEFALTLNGEQLADVLGRMDGDTVFVESSGPESATRVTGDHPTFIYYQMPVRTRD